MSRGFARSSSSGTELAQPWLTCANCVNVHVGKCCGVMFNPSKRNDRRRQMASQYRPCVEKGSSRR
ncbi:hypothetical protein BGW80DRAFT_1373353 [Lactifluus volemus]|nr:hypothetical protein BGW80DRAFT_1373353 [Lactifluus volemus]